jgi:hypothetical protein
MLRKRHFASNALPLGVHCAFEKNGVIKLTLIMETYLQRSLEIKATTDALHVTCRFQRQIKYGAMAILQLEKREYD